MALPPWTVELLRRGVQDLARQATDPETTAAIKQQASKLVEELPRVARERVDTLLKQAESSTQPLRDAWAQSDLLAGFTANRASNAGMPVRLINGSGILMHSRGSGIPYSSSVQAAAIPFLSGDVSVVPGIHDRLCSEIALRFENESGESPKYAALVSPSLPDALAAVSKLGRRGGCVFVPRCDSWRPLSTTAVEEANDGLTLVEAIQRRSQGAVREFGKMDQAGPVDLSEINRALQHSGVSEGPNSTSKRTAVIVRLAGTELPSGGLPEHVLNVAVIPAGTFVPHAGAMSLPSIEAELEAGADLVVLSGGALCGTPPVGIMVGRCEVMARLNNLGSTQPRFASLHETAMVAAAVVEQTQASSPVGRLLDVSEENLRDRAERLATQISGASFAQSVRVTNEPARFSCESIELGAEMGHSIPSRQVVVKTDQTNELVTRLASGNVEVLTTQVGEDLAIDLRWMTPDQQSLVASCFG